MGKESEEKANRGLTGKGKESILSVSPIGDPDLSGCFLTGSQLRRFP